MRVLVTGSSGYIGPALTEALQQAGHSVVGVDRVAPSNVEPDSFIHGDLLEDDTLRRAFGERIDLVAHLAAARVDWGLSDEEYLRDNVEATRRVVDAGAGRGVKRWLFYSSVGVFGPSNQPLGDDAPMQPDGVYGLSKARAEEMFDELARRDSEQQVVVVRPSAVYGPGNPDNTNVFRLIDALHRKRFVMIGRGDNVKTITYLPNLIEATLFLLDTLSPGLRRYVYVDEPRLTTRELVDELSKALGIANPTRHVPLALAKPLALPFDLLALATKRDLPITSARIEKFCRPTNYHRGAIEQEGFRPAVDTYSALAATVDWYLRTRGASVGTTHEMPARPLEHDRRGAAEL